MKHTRAVLAPVSCVTDTAVVMNRVNAVTANTRKRVTGIPIEYCNVKQIGFILKSAKTCKHNPFIGI